MLTGAEIASMRSTVEQTFTDSCHVLRSTQSADDQGGHSSTWGTVLANRACRVDPRTSGESMVAGALTAYADRMFRFAHSTDVRPADRIEYRSVTYEVVDVSTPRTVEIETRCAARDLRKGGESA